MELRQIRSFLSIAETLHFGRTAELIHLSQPALSLPIRTLEEEVGVRLFERSRRKAVAVPRDRRRFLRFDDHVNDERLILHEALGLDSQLTDGRASERIVSVGNTPTRTKQSRPAWTSFEDRPRALCL